MNGRCIPDMVLSINREAKKDAGEDSFCYSFGAEAGMLGVFDGCGGLGAQRHKFYSEKTEAYMASRLCAGAFFDSFASVFPGKDTAEKLAESYCAATSSACARVLTTYRPQKQAGELQIKGSMVRSLPSTVSAALIQKDRNGTYLVCPMWAGDSRTYLLTKDGLAQLTVDDISVPDPMENLYEDGILKNILCEGQTPQLHMTKVSLQEPFCVFSATDGCFGYFSTPMEFEGVLLETMLSSGSAAAWEAALCDRIGRVAGDDFTLCLAAYGFSSFRALQTAFSSRFKDIQNTYLKTLLALPKEDRETRRKLWASYKPQYERYLKEV